MKVVIIEDEIAASKRLSKILKEIDPNVEILDVLDTVEASVEWFSSHPRPDLAFMDIQLADGISLSIFQKVEVGCPVIFTTAYSEYAIDAFKVNSIDYLLKPVKAPELAQGLEKFRKLRPSAPPIDYIELMKAIKGGEKEYLKRFLVRIRQNIRKIEISEVAYFFTENKIVYLSTINNQRYPIDFTLDKLESQLDPEVFFRINRQFIVSINAINHMVAYSKSRVKLILEPATEHVDTIVSTERSPLFKKWVAGNK